MRVYQFYFDIFPVTLSHMSPTAQTAMRSYDYGRLKVTHSTVMSAHTEKETT